MADRQNEQRDTQRDETVSSQNPPNAVLQPEVRTATFWLYLGPLIAIFVIVGIALLYWTTRDGQPNEPVEPATGTSGESPGGFNPDPRPDSPQEEREFRQDAR